MERSLGNFIRQQQQSRRLAASSSTTAAAAEFPGICIADIFVPTAERSFVLPEDYKTTGEKVRAVLSDAKILVKGPNGEISLRTMSRQDVITSLARGNHSAAGMGMIANELHDHEISAFADAILSRPRLPALLDKLGDMGNADNPKEKTGSRKLVDALAYRIVMGNSDLGLKEKIAEHFYSLSRDMRDQLAIPLYDMGTDSQRDDTIKQKLDSADYSHSNREHMFIHANGKIQGALAGSIGLTSLDVAEALEAKIIAGSNVIAQINLAGAISDILYRPDRFEHWDETGMIEALGRWGENLARNAKSSKVIKKIAENFWHTYKIKSMGYDNIATTCDKNWRTKFEPVLAKILPALVEVTDAKSFAIVTLEIYMRNYPETLKAGFEETLKGKYARYWRQEKAADRLRRIHRANHQGGKLTA